MKRTAVVTGASSGIGEATVAALRQAGFEVIAGARRQDRLQRLAERTGARVATLDVRDAHSVEAFVSGIDECAVLVNNAGGALGLEPIAQADDDHWLGMYATNVLGTMRMTRALLPRLRRSGDGHIVVVGSIAGFEVYPGGGGYTAAKHAERALTRTLRLELLGEPIRVTEVDPGMVETEFSLVRLGDAQRARSVYEGMQPLTAEDVADCIALVVGLPLHVNVDQMVLRPLAQAAQHKLYRGRLFPT